MIGGFCSNSLVKLTVLFLTLTGSLSSVQDEISLPEWMRGAEYVTQCMDNRPGPQCDMTVVQQGKVTNLNITPRPLTDEACLEFWYLSPVLPNLFRLTVYLRDSNGLQKVWSQTAQSRSGVTTWTQVFVPLNNVKPGSKVIFRTIHPMSRGEQVAVNRIGIRKGSCGAQCEASTQLWADESTRCLCSEGQLSCSPAPSSGMCTVHSHTDCSTFDGAHFRFMDQCSYTLAKTCSVSEDSPQFSVGMVNGQSDNSSLPSVERVNVKINDFRMSFLRRQTQRVVVNGVWRTLPLTLARGTVTVSSNPAAVVLKSGFGLFVSFDYTGALHVTLPSSYSDKVCGLCGNFNHNRWDDLQRPDGSDAPNATDLVDSWQTEGNASACEAILVPHYCDPLEETEYASEAYCGALVSHTGPFAECQEALGAESYFRDCVYGMCASHGDPVVLCDTLQVYADLCKKAGVKGPMWRNSSFCSLQCGENSHYNACAEGCPEVCSPLDQVTSCGSCEERCECDPGFKLSGGQCVQEENCGCWYGGQHYVQGETIIEGECLQECVCIGKGNNNIECRPTQCAAGEACSVRNGVKGCFPFSPATCSVYGDPHYITFDGFAYDFHGGCSYVLTTTCGGKSSVEFTVTGHNMHPPFNNFTQSKLEAVTLEVGDLNITLNQSGHVYEHNRQVLLPYSTSGRYGQLKAYVDSGYTVLETTFGLRIMIDGQSRLFLQVNEHYKYELCGLCGTYSNRQDDDFVMPGGDNATSAFQFGESWRVQDSNQCVSHPNDPRECNSEEQAQAYDQCYTLLEDDFRLCHEAVHPEIYITSCVHDYCATNGNHITLCESLKSYAAACAVAGVELGQWQSGTICAVQATTISPVVTSTASPSPDQTLCPLNCDFESDLCGWEQLIQDSFDWTRLSDATPSAQTGPSHDHTSGDGFYIYIEGDSVYHGDSARMLSSLCQYKGPMCLHFWYHMYGSATAMALNIYLLQGSSATKIWSKQTNQGPTWQPGHAEITASGPFQIILEGIRGSTVLSDVAIDDISVHFGTCSDALPVLASGIKLSTTSVIHTQQVCNLGCSFDRNLCNWNQMMTDAFDWSWHSGSTPSLMTGPSADHSGGGHYLYIEASSVTYGDTARLISSECPHSGAQCLQFWYHMYGSADTMGLHVYVVEGRNARSVWRQRNDQGNMWHLAQVDLTTAEHYQIIFEGRRGSNDQSDVAIDDVSLHFGPCSDLSEMSPSRPAVTAAPISTTDRPQTTMPVSPGPIGTTAATHYHHTDNFESQTTQSQSPTTAAPATTALKATPEVNPEQVCNLGCRFDKNLCNWNQMVTDAFDWTWHSGTTPTLMTGPSADHSGGGHYLYIEASSVTYGDTARLISSECPHSGAQCLQFWYHMYGSADTMGLHVYVVEGRNAHSVWRQRNDQGNMWHLAQVDLTTAGAYQIIFEGRRGSNDQSDVAIDDVSLYYGPCSDMNRPTTSRPATTAAHITATSEPQTTIHVAPETSWTPHPTTDSSESQSTQYPEPESTQMYTTEELRTTVMDWTTANKEPLTTEAQTAQTSEGPLPPTTAEARTDLTIDASQPTTPENLETTAGQSAATGDTGIPTRPSEGQTTVGAQPPTMDHTEQTPPEATEMHTTAGADQTTAATAGPQPPTSPEGQLPTTGDTGVQTRPTEAQTTANPEPPATTKEPLQTTANSGPEATTAARPETGATSERPQPPTDGKPEDSSTTTAAHATEGPQPTTVTAQTTTTESPPLPTTTAAASLPPETPSPTPSCPANTHYSSCVSSCTPTCSHLYGPPGCSDSDCVAGCVCDDGFVLKRRICVPIQECGCMDTSGKKYEFGDVWYSSHCSEKCKCEKRRGVGRIECEEKDECDGKAVCLQNNNGHYYCEKTDFSDCSINTDPEYRTFDKKKHEFEGEHSYVLVQTKNLPNNLKHIYIEGINGHDEDEDDDSSEERDSRQARDDDDDSDENSEEDKEGVLRALKIRVYNHTVVLKPHNRLIVDGSRVDAPLSPSPGLKIEEHSSRIYVKTDFGLSVEFDRHSKAEIILPHLYKRRVGGLCGNFDGHKSNDFMKPDGTQATGVQEFGESWRV